MQASVPGRLECCWVKNDRDCVVGQLLKRCGKGGRQTGLVPCGIEDRCMTGLRRGLKERGIHGAKKVGFAKSNNAPECFVIAEMERMK